MSRTRALALTFLGSLLTASCLIAAPGGAVSAAAEADAADPEIESLRDRYSNTYEQEDGSYRAEIAAAPINYELTDGEWRPIDNTLVPSARPGYAYENAANSYKALFPEDLAADPIRVEASGESIEFRLDGATGAPAEPGSEDADEVTAAYPNALPGVELSYRVGAEGVEELIELPTPEAAQEFSFETELSEGLELSGEGTGASVTEPGSGEVFELAPPLAYDAAGETDPLELEIDHSVAGADAEVSVTPDPDWLSEPEREYPVVVDPTVISKIDYDPSGEPLDAAKDCWIEQGLTIVHCDDDLKVGYASDGKERRSLLQFKPSIPPHALITSATLDLYANGGNYPTGQPIPVQLHQIDPDEGWSRNVIWRDRIPGTEWEVPGGTVEGSVVDTAAPEIGFHAQWDVKPIVEKWVSYEAKNRGFRLAPEPQTGTKQVTFTGSEVVAAEEKRPSLTIVYEPRRDVVPGTGKVLAEDLATGPNPCLIWGGITDPHLDGCNSSGASDPYIIRRQGDGDPHLPVGKTSASTSYRRYISTAGVQSIYDATCDPDTGGPCNESTRTQTQAWTTSQNPMSFGPGKYVFYLSFRLQSPSPFPYAQAPGGGNSKYSQLLQFKSHGASLNTHLPLSATIGNDGIKFIYRELVYNPETQEYDAQPLYQDIINLEPGRWIRLALVANWRDGGWYEVWADLDESGEIVNVLPRRSNVNLLEGRPAASWGIGLYHAMSLFDGTILPDQPRQETVYTDYASAQRTEFQD